MLESLSIKNYRLFEDFQLPRLSAINLFVGKNNSGKSALLEAIQIWATNANVEILNEIVQARDGYWESELEEQNSSAELVENPLRSMFRGHHLPQIGTEGIEIGPIGKSHLRIQTNAYQVVQEQEVFRRVPLNPSDLAKKDLADVRYVLEARQDDSTWQLGPIRGEPRDFRRPIPSRTSREPKCTVQSVPAHNITDQKLAILWDKIHLTDLESAVTDCLKLITPNLMGIAFVGEPPRIRGKRIPIVRLKDSAERLPLKTLGDGMTRLLEIALSLVNSKDGILVVDEFENGLHWAVQPQVWRLVFFLTQQLNIRVFATTHSQDCVRAFHSIWKRNESAGTFHRIEKNGHSSPFIRAYDCETLADAIQSEVEVR
jgi:hypothetical protein